MDLECILKKMLYVLKFIVSNSSLILLSCTICGLIYTGYDNWMKTSFS